MPRPCKRRRICEMPQNRRFLPSDTAQGNSEPVIMALDEYETIRLIDFEGMNQEEGVHAVWESPIPPCRRSRTAHAENWRSV